MVGSSVLSRPASPRLLGPASPRLVPPGGCLGGICKPLEPVGCLGGICKSLELTRADDVIIEGNELLQKAKSAPLDFAAKSILEAGRQTGHPVVMMGAGVVGGAVGIAASPFIAGYGATKFVRARAQRWILE